MKLRLVAKNGIPILVVTEDLSHQHAEVLKMGIAKLFQSGKRTIILDLTGVTHAEPVDLTDVAAFGLDTPEVRNQLIVASPIEGVGHAPNLLGALQLVGTPIAKLMATEAWLKNRFKTLEKKRVDLKALLEKAGPGSGEIKSLKMANGELKRLVGNLEQQIEQFLKDRKAPIRSDFLRINPASVEDTLKAILEQEGILQVT